MSKQTYEVGDIVTFNCSESHRHGQEGVYRGTARDGTMSVQYGDGLLSTGWLPQYLHPVVATADHVGQWARITDGMVPKSTGTRGRFDRIGSLGGPVIVDAAGRLHSANPGGAVLVTPPSPDPEPAWSPVKGGRAIVAVAKRSDSYRSSFRTALRDGEEVTIVRGPGRDGDWWCETPDGARWGFVATRHLRPVPEPVDAVIYDYVDERARLRRTQQALAHVKGQRDEARAGVHRLRDGLAVTECERDAARDEVARRIVVDELRKANTWLKDRADHVPDPAEGLTVSPDGQRVVDADGEVVINRGGACAAYLKTEAITRNDNAIYETRIAAALRLLADHAEAAEKAPTVDEDVRTISGGVDSDKWNDDREAALQRLRNAAARAARTGEGV